MATRTSSRLQGRGHPALEEVLGRDGAGAERPVHDHRRVERDRRARQFGSGVGVRQAAADRASVAVLDVADVAGGLRQQRNQFADQRVVLQLVLPNPGAHLQDVGPALDLLQVTDLVDVDQCLRPGKPHVEHGEKALSSREDEGVVAVLALERDGLIDGFGIAVREWRRLHRLSLVAAPGRSR